MEISWDLIIKWLTEHSDDILVGLVVSIIIGVSIGVFKMIVNGPYYIEKYGSSKVFKNLIKVSSNNIFKVFIFLSKYIVPYLAIVLMLLESPELDLSNLLKFSFFFILPPFNFLLWFNNKLQADITNVYKELLKLRNYVDERDGQVYEVYKKSIGDIDSYMTGLKQNLDKLRKDNKLK